MTSCRPILLEMRRETIHIGNTDREKSYFLNMYLRDSRALDYLMTRPTGTAQTIVFDGNQHGRSTSHRAGGLRPEKNHGRTGLGSNPAPTQPGDLHGPQKPVIRTGHRRSRGHADPLYFGSGQFRFRIRRRCSPPWVSIDTTSPPAGIWAALNQIPVAKSRCP